MPTPAVPSDADPIDSRLAAVYQRLAARERLARERLVSEVPAAIVNAIPGVGSQCVSCARVREWRRQGRIFAFRHELRDHFPLFQFSDGAPKPIVHDVLNFLQPDNHWYTMFWFAGANAWLEDRSPLELLDEDPAAVLEAASHANDEISD